MKTKISTSIRILIRVAFVTLLVLLAGKSNSALQAQSCVMACPEMNPPLGIFLDADCTATLTLTQLGVIVTECLGPFTIDIIVNDVSVGDVVTQDMIGQTFMVIVNSETEGQLCMTAIFVQDKLPPQFTCPDDITVGCTMALESIPVSTTDDAVDCSDVSISTVDVLEYSGECDSVFISKYTRTYYVVDDYGNATTCTQMIFFEALDLEDVIFPPDLKGVDALLCFPAPDTTPGATGIPEIDGFPILNGVVCNLSATYSDEVAALCSGGYKIFRTWVVTDWCDGNVSIDSLQIIEVADLTPPEVVSLDTLIVSAGAGCIADIVVPPAQILEDCSLDIDVRIQGVFGTIQGNGGLVNDLPLGVHKIIYIATNDCNLEGRDTLTILVVDNLAPIPVCNASVVVPVGAQGMSTVYASAFDGGSSDNCAPVFFKVRRMDAPLGFQCFDNANFLYQFDDVIKFCCEDISNDNLMIILRVYDVQPLPGIVSNNYLLGHFADCMLQVQIQDKTAPVIDCPSDLTISCVFDYDPDNLSVFGDVVTDPSDREDICLDDPGNPYTNGITCVGIDGIASDNCFVSISDTAIFNINPTCGTGYIQRIFKAINPGGLAVSCEQRISIINYTPFSGSDIVWPPDYVTEDICDVDLLDAEDLPAPYNSPIVQDDECDLVTFTHQDLIFDFSISHQACFKILRTWTVLDWCQYETGGKSGIWTRTQVIKVVNTEGPELVMSDLELILCTDDPECGPGNVLLEASASDDCSGSDALQWIISVDEDDNGSLDQIFSAILDETVQQSVLLPLGHHRILYSVEDLCGNVSTEEQFVTMESCKPPSAKCRNLATSLMPVDSDGDLEADWGMVTLWATDLDAGSNHACGNPVSLAFSSNPSDVSRIFDCSDLGENFIELWVIDENDNTDFCIVSIKIQDNLEICPLEAAPRAIVKGQISTSLLELVPGVNVSLVGSNIPPQATNTSGNYAFPPMPYGGSYKIEPILNSDYKRGVSTLDLILLQKHLLGVQSLDNPYRMIAGDANRSETLSAMDIVILRRLILGITEEIPNNTSWRFVDAAYQFNDPSNPLAEPFPESYHIDLLAGDMDVNFIAVKVGDVNGSVMSSFNQDVIEARNSPVSISMGMKDQVLKSGETCIVQVNCDRMAEIDAMQFTLEWDPQLIDVIPISGSSLLTDIQWSTSHLLQGLLPVSWTKYDHDDSQISSPVLSLQISAKVNLMLSQAGLNIGESITPVEGVLTDGRRMEPHFTYLPLESTTTDLLVYQNRPNPFTRKSMIPFVLPDASDVKLEVHNIEGKLVYRAELSGNAGYNEILLDAQQWGGQGVYTYSISTTKEYRTLRMIVVGE